MGLVFARSCMKRTLNQHVFYQTQKRVISMNPVICGSFTCSAKTRNRVTSNSLLPGFIESRLKLIKEFGDKRISKNWKDYFTNQRTMNIDTLTRMPEWQDSMMEMIEKGRNTPVPEGSKRISEEHLVKLSHYKQHSPAKLPDLQLEGHYVRLRMLDIEKDAAILHQRSNGTPISIESTLCHNVDAYDSEEVIWKWMPASNPIDQSLDEFIEKVLKPILAPNHYTPFCVIDRSSNSPIGIVCLMNNFPEHLKCELGWIWFSPVAQRTWANTEANFLLMEYVFETLAYRRVEWKCDSLNQRSRAAAEKLGFTFECVQQNHIILKYRNRDTAWYRILDTEWPEKKVHLQARLAGK